MSVLPSQGIVDLINSDSITSTEPIDKSQIQPASLDVRLGNKMYIVPGEFLPGRDYSMDRFLREEARIMMNIDGGGIISPGYTYIIPLQESLHAGLSIKGNPKSTTGRLGIVTRLVTNGSGKTENSFDTIHFPYEGPLFLIVSTRVFEFIVRTGDTLHQIRFSTSQTYNDCDNVVSTLSVPIDLNGLDSDIIGYKAKESGSRFPGPIDLRKPKTYDKFDYWTPIYRTDDHKLLLQPGYFYIMASADKAFIDPMSCGEMVPYDSTLGEFRIHMAGFFDPGFGYGKIGEIKGAHSVFEIVPHAPVYIKHNQIVAKLKMERMTEAPLEAYGSGIASNYQAQTLALAKHFI